ncbi:hypothetical protein DRO97_08585 [Archaeoglobales archaeon]|nr:MAG: hypothetical protein DRO97_08585 [Archaeoglobales archaeon]
MKVFVIGLDGATFKLINKFNLPNIHYLMKNGAYGIMETCLPYYTTPAWKCYSTGLYPSKLGIYNFIKISIDKTNNTVKSKLVNSTDFKAKEIWDYLTDYGYKSCVIDMPNTNPVKPINGIMVGHYLIGKNYVHPPEFKKVLDELNYTDPEYWYLSGEEQLAVLEQKIQSRFDLFLHLLKTRKDIDFWHLTIFDIDSVQHSYWGNNEVLRQFWKLIDDNIGLILGELDKLNENYVLFLMSDHGFKECKGTIYLNEYLISEGLLKLKFNPNDGLRKLIHNPTVFNFLRKTHLLNLLRRTVPERVKERVKIASTTILDQVNVNKSKAFFPGTDQLYILKDYDKVVESLSNLPIDIYKTNELYPDAGLDAPDLIFDSDFKLAPDIGVGKMFDDTNKWLGIHDRDAIFIAYGNNIKRMEVNATIYDLAPTILSLFNIKPKLDGEVLEIFEKV